MANPIIDDDPISDEEAAAIVEELRAKPDDMRSPQDNLAIELYDMVMEAKRRFGRR